MKKELRLISGALLFTVASLNATNYYISNSGSDSNNGTSPSTAFLTIQTATNIVVAGDCVLVANGNYASFSHTDLASGTILQPIVYKALGKSVVITSGNAHGHNGINVEDCDCIHIIGFRSSGWYFTYGTTNNTNGIRIINSDHSVVSYNVCDSNTTGILTGYCDYLTIEHNTCRYNGGGSAGQHGIYHSNGGDYATIRYNVCTDNLGAGIQFNPDFSAQDQPNDGINTGSNCSFNILGRDHIGINSQGLDSAIISNNLIYDFGNNGITFYHGESAAGTTNSRVFNNTIVANGFGNCPIFLQNEVSGLLIYNNILINTDNTHGSICFYDGPTTKDLKSDFNIVSNAFCDNGTSCSETFSYWQTLGYDANSILTPATLTSLFVNPSTDDFHLVGGSIAVNAGTNLVGAAVTLDLDGLVRPAGGAYDIGCYEFGSSPTGIRSYTQATKNTVLANGTTAFVTNADPSDKIYFYDVVGNLVHFGNNWNYTDQSTGIYMYSIVSEKNNTQSNGKFMISHQ